MQDIGLINNWKVSASFEFLTQEVFIILNKNMLNFGLECSSPIRTIDTSIASSALKVSWLLILLRN